MKKTLSIILTTAVLAAVPVSQAFSLDVLGGLGKIGTGIKKVQEVKQQTEQVVEAVETINRAAEPITSADAYSIGRTVSANILTEYKLNTSNPKATSYLNKICKAIAMNSNTAAVYKDYSVAIIDSDDINAFSTCGGHIFLTTGIIRLAKSEDELAAVIAHELAHINLEHAVVAIKTVRTTDAISKTANVSKDLTKKYGNLNNDQKGGLDLLTGANLKLMDLITETGYTKDQEFKADAVAVQLMFDAGYDPSAMIDVLKMIKENNPEDKADSGWHKTHPKPEERIKKVQTVSSKMKFTGSDRSVRQSRFEKNTAGI